MAYARALENPDLFMRLVVLLFIGLVVGASSGIAVVNTLRQRDAYPRGLMDVMQHHYAALRDDTRRGHCELSAHHLDMLRNLAGEIGDAVYGEDIPDSPFREYNTRLLDALNAPNATECKALAAQSQKIGAVCDDCHRQYR